VSASAKLWMVSPRRATEPLTATMTSWNAAVAANAASEILRARRPSPLLARAVSTESPGSWLCDENTDLSSPRRPPRCSWPWASGWWR
jgi:hypothetical protein